MLVDRASFVVVSVSVAGVVKWKERKKKSRAETERRIWDNRIASDGAAPKHYAAMLMRRALHRTSRAMTC